MGSRIRNVVRFAAFGAGAVWLARRPRRPVADLRSIGTRHHGLDEVDRRRDEYARSYAGARRAAADPDVMATLTHALKALDDRVAAASTGRT